MLLNDVADITQGCAGFYNRDRLVQAFLAGAYQALGVIGYLADTKHLAGIAMEAVLQHSNIDVDDVTGLQDFAVTRNTVADNVIHRRADGLGEAVVVQRRRNRLLSVDDIVMADTVELAGADTRLNVGSDHLQDFGGKSADHAHFVDVGG